MSPSSSSRDSHGICSCLRFLKKFRMFKHNDLASHFKARQSTNENRSIAITSPNYVASTNDDDEPASVFNQEPNLRPTPPSTPSILKSSSTSSRKTSEFSSSTNSKILIGDAIELQDSGCSIPIDTLYSGPLNFIRKESPYRHRDVKRCSALAKGSNFSLKQNDIPNAKVTSSDLTCCSDSAAIWRAVTKAFRTTSVHHTECTATGLRHIKSVKFLPIFYNSQPSDAASLGFANEATPGSEASKGKDIPVVHIADRILSISNTSSSDPSVTSSAAIIASTCVSLNSGSKSSNESQNSCQALLGSDNSVQSVSIGQAIDISELPNVISSDSARPWEALELNRLSIVAEVPIDVKDEPSDSPLTELPAQSSAAFAVTNENISERTVKTDEPFLEEGRCKVRHVRKRPQHVCMPESSPCTNKVLEMSPPTSPERRMYGKETTLDLPPRQSQAVEIQRVYKRQTIARRSLPRRSTHCHIMEDLGIKTKILEREINQIETNMNEKKVKHSRLGRPKILQTDSTKILANFISKLAANSNLTAEINKSVLVQRPENVEFVTQKPSSARIAAPFKTQFAPRFIDSSKVTKSRPRSKNGNAKGMNTKPSSTPTTTSSKMFRGQNTILDAKTGILKYKRAIRNVENLQVESQKSLTLVQEHGQKSYAQELLQHLKSRKRTQHLKGFQGNTFTRAIPKRDETSSAQRVTFQLVKSDEQRTEEKNFVRDNLLRMGRLEVMPKAEKIVVDRFGNTTLPQVNFTHKPNFGKVPKYIGAFNRHRTSYRMTGKWPKNKSQFS